MRAYLPADETSWLRCRVLAFLGSSYYDDVETTKPDLDALVQLVAVVADGTVIGVLDASLDGASATLETIGVHPDHQCKGVAGRLLREAFSVLSSAGATSITAWTRNDLPALAWYDAQGFVETFRYLHVYANDYLQPVGEPLSSAVRQATGLSVVAGFFHADISREEELRAAFPRVYICRSLELSLAAPSA